VDSIRSTESLLTFRNSQEIPSRGTIMHLSRNLVVFEVYNPYSIVQLSEVLHDLNIHRGERIIYNGRAVVSNLVNTGLMLIVSATLVDSWSELKDLTGQTLSDEVRGFIEDWDKSSSSITPIYRTSVSCIRNFLEELSQWLAQGEVVAGIVDTRRTDAQTRDFVNDVEGGVLPKIAQLFTEFESVAQQVPPDLVTNHKVFARHEIHPLILCSPFIHRTFTKPLGYAGDYEMVNMMLRDPWEGANTYAKIINSIIIKSDGARAHRNRIVKLLAYLEQESIRVQKLGRPLRVLNVACGPAAEVQQFIRTSEHAERCQLSLLDFNAETLEYTRGKIKEAVRASGRLPSVEFIHKSIHDLLQEARGRKDTASGATYDFVYCAGLFDYLSDKICARLLDLFYRWTEPGGLVVSTNVHPKNPVRFFLEHLLEWNLIYRDQEQMMAIKPFGSQSVVTEEETRVNIFLESRKPLATS
jgi:extracellular factor (EF) 3-hydroxypalmitic acid methyl ester biosynthesis protein